MNLVIHIGRHKSGTSSVQHWLYSNPKVLSRGGFLYPTSGLCGRVAHHVLAHALNHKTLDTQRANKIALDIRREATNSDTVIISSEGFQNISNIEPLLEFQSILGIPKDRTRVICYLREHLDYAMSAYRQKIHNQASAISFKAYTAVFRDLSPFFLRWKKVGSLELSWFSRQLLAGGDIVEDFCKRIRIMAESYSIPNKNISIGGNLLVLKLVANKMGYGNLPYSEITRLAEDYKSYSQPFYLSNDWCEMIRSGSSYNESIINEIGSDPPYQTWSHCAKLPDLACLREDAHIFCDRLAISDVGAIYETAVNSYSYFSTG